MLLHIPAPEIDPGELGVNIDGGVTPYAVISLDETGGARLVIQSVTDADRLIRAAVDAKDKLIAATGARVRVPGSHHAPGPDEGSEVAWSDEPGTQAPEMCDAELPLNHLDRLVCTLDDGHYGAHSALRGKRRWHGTGTGARKEDGSPAEPEGSRP